MNSISFDFSVTQHQMHATTLWSASETSRSMHAWSASADH